MFSLFFFIFENFHEMINEVLIALGSAGISGTRDICKKNQSRKYLLKPNGASVNCSFSTEKDPLLPSIQQLTDARLIYSVSAALGHNKVFTCYIFGCFSVPLNPFLHILLSNLFARRNHIQNAAQEFLPFLMLLRRMSSFLRHETIHIYCFYLTFFYIMHM